MSDRIIQAYYGEYPRINKRTPVDITSRVESDHFASLFEAIEDDCNLEPYGFKIGDYFESHNFHTVTQDLSSGTESNTVKFRYWLAHPDLYYGPSSIRSVINKHHFAIVVDFNTNKRWNDGTFTGYEPSRIHQWLKGSDALGNIKKDLSYILTGSESNISAAEAHIIEHGKLFYVYTDPSNPTWTWVDSVISCLTEMDVYGACIMSNREGTNYMTRQEGETGCQLELFRKYRISRILMDEGTIGVWLRSIALATSACISTSSNPDSGKMINSRRVFGIILLKADPT